MERLYSYSGLRLIVWGIEYNIIMCFSVSTIENGARGGSSRKLCARREYSKMVRAAGVLENGARGGSSRLETRRLPLIYNPKHYEPNIVTARD